MTVERSDVGAGDSFGAAINALERIEFGFGAPDDPDVPDGVTTDEIRFQALLHHSDQWLWQTNGSDPKWCSKALDEALAMGLVTHEGGLWRLG